MFDKKKYIDLLGFMESNNDYSIINSIGAIGRYQFMPATLRSLKQLYNLPDWKNASYFASNPNLQDVYIDALINDSLNYISQSGFNKYLNQPVSGSIRFKGLTSKLSTSGMLAGIHLSGGGNLKRFFQDGYNPNDGFTSLSDYAAFFSSKLPETSNFLPLALAFIPAIVLYLT